jgi:hypothetical protein
MFVVSLFGRALSRHNEGSDVPVTSRQIRFPFIETHALYP